MANLIPQSPTSGGMSYGGILNFWDALKEDIDTINYLPYGDEYYSTMNQIINAVGNREIAKQPSVSWFENSRMEVPFTVETVNVASGVYTIDIPASEVDASTGYSFPSQYDIWVHAKTLTPFQIISKTDANTLVLKPVDSFSGSITAGDKFFYSGDSVPEGSSPVQPKYVFNTKLTAYLQSMRNDKQSTSEALFDQLWYDQWENGIQTPFSNSADVYQLQRSHLVGMVNTFFTGTTGSNLASTTSFQTTDGLYQTVLERGQKQDSGGDIDEVDFYALEALLSTQNGAIKNYMIWNSGNTSAQIEQNLLDYQKNANIQVVHQELAKTFYGDGDRANLMSSTFSFNAMVFNNKNFAQVRMGLFDNPQTFNVTDSAWQDVAFVLPAAKAGSVDDGLGMMGKYVRLCHKPDAFMNMWYTGGRAPQNRTGVWELRIHLVSEFAFKFVNANNYGMFYNPA
jgi:hypothetical protein